VCPAVVQEEKRARHPRYAFDEAKMLEQLRKLSSELSV
jgi:hypothetical protein